jgi:TolB protein
MRKTNAGWHSRHCIAPLLAFAMTTGISGQWTNRYPKVEGFSHHVYLEGYELPILTVGPIDPAPAPDGVTVAFSSRGWIWLLDLRTSVATRLTVGGAMDSRPTWSPDGSLLAFVRDDGRDTWIVMRDIASGGESEINTPAIDLDPAFSPDGVFLYYASASAGTIDIWRRDLEAGLDEPVVVAPGTQLKPQVSADGERLLFLEKRGADAIRLRSLLTREERTLHSDRLASMSRPALSPDGEVVVFNWPTQERYELRLLRVSDPGSTLLLTHSGGLPLTPAWSPDGEWIYFAEADASEVFHLKRIAAAGGSVVDVPVLAWDWREETGTVRITTSTPVRLSVTDEQGHPVIPAGAQSRFDGQNGRVFFYSPGVTEIVVPAGNVTVSAVRGITTPETVAEVEVDAGRRTDVALEPVSIWNPAEHGWRAGDHHFHLNYGGQYQLTPDDLVLMMEAEQLDVATPLLANLHNRFEDQKYWTGPTAGTMPIVRFGQEIRSHFLGHVGLIGITDLFWPWIWGPGYQVYGTDDRPNTDALEHARHQGGMSIYVHPFSAPDPLSETGMTRVPVELVVDGVLGDFDLLEVVCLWSNELGTTELWHRFLNIGVPIAPSGGTDVMNNFYRTMAIGTARVYVQTGDATSWDAYADALRHGRSFVTTGPLVDLRLEGVGPGGILEGTRRVEWNLDLHSASAVERIELIVNGQVVWDDEGLNEGGSRTYNGNVELPGGGWVAARAFGGETVWPAMGNFPFAHTAPVWIDSVGSTEPQARIAAARDLLRILDVSLSRLRDGYSGVEIPRLEGKFAEARNHLLLLIQVGQ